MSTGNRNVIIALGLIALLTILIAFWTWPVAPKLALYGEENPRAGEYHPGGKNCEPEALASIRDGGKRASQTDACRKEAEEYRLSTNDLIQQTRAANAAQAQANIASQQLWTGWLQTLGGFLTLAAAAGAAIYARDAAKHTREANELARSHHQEALRPYIFVSKGWFEIDDNFQPIAHLELKNFGQSPSIDTQTWYHIWIECFPLHDTLPVAPHDLPKSTSVIGPGGTSEISHPRGRALNRYEREELAAGRAAMYVYGETTYADIFGKWHWSQFTLFAGGAHSIVNRRLAPYRDGNAIDRAKSGST